jgi:beta-glucanase (GH16 family)
MRSTKPTLDAERDVPSAQQPGAARVALVASVLCVLAASCQSSEPTSDSEATSLATVTTTVPATTTTVPATTTTTVPPTTTTIVVPDPVPIETIEGWELVWNDEFDGDAVDTTKWNYDIGGWGWGNGEAQYYTPRSENAFVENGLLTIVLRQEQYENSYYTSARLKTEGLHEFQYGRVEARMKVPRGAGTWPAFWMLGSSFERDPDDPLSSNWPQAGEIDVMEHVGRKPNVTFGTVHGPGYAGAGGLGGWNTQVHDIADDFHTYAVEWDESGIEWFYDGEPFFDLGPEDIGDREWVFDQPFFLIVNLALGGGFPGPIALDLEYPLYLYVDHVRVYQAVEARD